MSQKRTIKGSAVVLEARRILQKAKAFIIMADTGEGNTRVFSYGYTGAQVQREMAKILMGLTLKAKAAAQGPQGLSQSPAPPFPEPPALDATPHLYGTSEPPPAFAPNESEATSDG